VVQLSRLTAEDAYHPDKEIRKLNLPILGICYWYATYRPTVCAGEVVPANHHEYGKR